MKSTMKKLHTDPNEQVENGIFPKTSNHHTKHNLFKQSYGFCKRFSFLLLACGRGN